MKGTAVRPIRQTACASRHGVSVALPACAPPRAIEVRAARAQPTRRWLPCGARTRSSRACLAAGSGFGGRCGNHGGLSTGPGRRGATLVVLSGDDDLAPFTPVIGERRRREPWRLAVIPSRLAQGLGELSLVSAGPCAQALREGIFLTEKGRRIRGLDQRWPKLVGFRILLRLLERGRIEYGIFTERFVHELLNRERLPIERLDAGMMRMEPAALLAALRAVGQPMKKRPKPERDHRPALGWVRGGVKRIGGEP